MKKWGIYRANLDPIIGSEQGKSRPVLVISENEINGLLNVVNVLPITTRKSDRIIYPNETALAANSVGLMKESIVLCYQIRTLDKQRLTKQYGKIELRDKQKEIIAALCFQLGINPSK